MRLAVLRWSIVAAAIATAACDRTPSEPDDYEDDLAYLPRRVATTQAFTQLAMGYGHSCALTATGEAWCWGVNSDGQLGTATETFCIGDTPCSWQPVRSAAPRLFASLHPGLTRSCGLDDAGAVACWTHHGAEAPLPERVNAEAVGFAFARVAVGWSRRCGITADAELWCWGIPYPTHAPVPGIDTPVEVDVGTPIREVGLGDAHGCALDTADRAWCWGSNWWGQLGVGSTSPDFNPVPQLVHGEHLFASIAVAGQGACGLKASGEAWCWGMADLIGDGVGVSRNVPTRVAGEHHFAALTAGAEHACGLKANRTAWCWGEGIHLGADLYERSEEPVAVAGNHLFTQIAAGGVATCGLTLDGDVYCWGINTYGATGQQPRR